MSVSKWFARASMVTGLLLALSPAVSAQPPRPDHEITKLADDVYLFRHQFHQAIFIITPEGVIVIDPMVSETFSCIPVTPSRET